MQALVCEYVRAPGLHLHQPGVCGSVANATEFVTIFERRKFPLYSTKKILEVNQAVTQGFNA